MLFLTPLTSLALFVLVSREKQRESIFLMACEFLVMFFIRKMIVV